MEEGFIVIDCSSLLTIKHLQSFAIRRLVSGAKYAIMGYQVPCDGFCGSIRPKDFLQIFQNM